MRPGSRSDRRRSFFFLVTLRKRLCMKRSYLIVMQRRYRS